MAARGLLVVLVAACSGSGASATAQLPMPRASKVASVAAIAGLEEAIAAERMVEDVRWLCDPARAGRGFYRAGARVTADWVAAQFRAAGLQVFRQPIQRGDDNVIGVLAGDADAVLVSAHYDHLGVDADGVMYPGADDNASGVAAMLAISRAVAARARATQGRAHTVIFVAFGAEEDGLRGSSAYVNAPVWPLERTLVAINFDMVGRKLFGVLGTGGSHAVAVVGLEANPGYEMIARRAAAAEHAWLVAGSADLVRRFGFDGRTDDWWFRQKGVSTMHFSTGLHRDYHRPSDTLDRLEPQQMAAIARIAARIVIAIAKLGPPL